MRKTDRAWLAAMIDGEGYLGWNVVKSYPGRKRPVYRGPVIEVRMYDKDIVARVAKLMGKKVLGPYGPYGISRKAHYQAQVYGQDAIRVLKLILPWLGKRRTKRAKELLKWNRT